MRKFEYLLSKFIKNGYENIELSKNHLKKIEKSPLIVFVLIPFILIISFGIGMIIFYIRLEEKSFFEIMYNFYFYAFFILIFYTWGYFIKNYFHIKFSLAAFYLFSIQFLAITFVSLLLTPLSILGIIEDIEFNTILFYYATCFILIIYYYYYYNNKWSNLIITKYYNQIKKILKSNSYIFDSNNKLYSFDLNEYEKDKPKLTKVGENVISFMMRFGLTIPVLAVLSSNGVGESGLIYFSIYLMLFIVPMVMKMISRPMAIYSILKQIEKEENVIIYNGKKVDSI